MPSKSWQRSVEVVEELGIIASSHRPNGLCDRERGIERRLTRDDPSLARIGQRERNPQDFPSRTCSTRLFPCPKTAAELISRTLPKLIGRSTMYYGKHRDCAR